MQITTKGGSFETVERGIDNVIAAVGEFPLLKKLVIVEVVTEDATDIEQINQAFSQAPISVKGYLLPKDYETPLHTKLKARALHYMVEQHRLAPRDAYVIHYDEESVLTPDNVARLCSVLMETPIGISEGPISYALEWGDAHPLCRTMESNRPFGCHECYLMMTNPAPLHLHGSNLVIQEKLENEIGWDIGQYNNNPLIAEDLVFGLMAYLKFGKEAFGWHGVEMIEQPPFTVKAAYKQRERWVMGALQGVAHVSSLPGYSTLSLYDRARIQLIIRLRVLTYALGLPISIVSLCVLFFTSVIAWFDWCIGFPVDLHISLLALPGLLMWLGSNQIGLNQNLSYTNYTKWQKFVEHLIVLVLTPFSGLFDTVGPAKAVVKWTFGIRGMKWIPTPKSITQEFGDNDVVLVGSDV
jgi:hypothetical protein